MLFVTRANFVLRIVPEHSHYMRVMNAEYPHFSGHPQRVEAVEIIVLQFAQTILRLLAKLMKFNGMATGITEVIFGHGFERRETFDDVFMLRSVL